MNYVHNYDACVYRASTNIRNMGLQVYPAVGLESLPLLYRSLRGTIPTVDPTVVRVKIIPPLYITNIFIPFTLFPRFPNSTWEYSSPIIITFRKLITNILCYTSQKKRKEPLNNILIL